jgi:hypothetical protein
VGYIQTHEVEIRPEHAKTPDAFYSAQTTGCELQRPAVINCLGKAPEAPCKYRRSCARLTMSICTKQRNVTVEQMTSKGRANMKRETKGGKTSAVKKPTRPGPMTVEHEHWGKFIDFLLGADGCNFHRLDPNDAGSLTWTCDGTDAYPISRRILAEMGLTPDDIDQSVEYFRRNGAYCDCEVVLNIDQSVRKVAVMSGIRQTAAGGDQPLEPEELRAPHRCKLAALVKKGSKRDCYASKEVDDYGQQY